MPEQYTNFSNIIMDEQHMAQQASQFHQQQQLQQEQMVQQQIQQAQQQQLQQEQMVQQQIQQAQQQKIALGDRQMDMAKWYWGQRDKIVERGDPSELQAFEAHAKIMMPNHAFPAILPEDIKQMEMRRAMTQQGFVPMAAGQTLDPASSGQYAFAQAGGHQYIKPNVNLPESLDQHDARILNLRAQELQQNQAYQSKPETYQKDNTPPHIRNLQKFTDEHLQEQYDDYKAIADKGNIMATAQERINARNIMTDIRGIMDERASKQVKAEPKAAAQGGEDKSSAYSKFELLPGEAVYVQALKAKGYSISQIQSLLVKVRSKKLHPSAFYMPPPEQMSEVGTTQTDLAMAGSP